MFDCREFDANALSKVGFVPAEAEVSGRHIAEVIIVALHYRMLAIASSTDSDRVQCL